MQQLNFPVLQSQLRHKNNVAEVWDIVRKKWILLTPEEWVRQHLIQYLHTEKGFSIGLMAVEKAIQFNGMMRRYDLVLYNQQSQPVLLAECKAPDIRITQQVFDQAARYNLVMKVPYLLITNGLEHYCSRIDFENSSFEFLREIPNRVEII
ncbi:MAG TPA: type I restriction enzyme HsdR N-terminal domain-containing protein [Flavobacteriales bacterium]